MILTTVALAGASLFGATFDGTDMTPDYMTGIQQVYAVAEDGTEVYVPVFSLPVCEDEDGTGDPCVWYAPSRGNGVGRSFIQLGTEENRTFATVSPWAAEILVERAPAEVKAVEPVEEPVKAVERVNPEEWGYEGKQVFEFNYAEFDAKMSEAKGK